MVGPLRHLQSVKGRMMFWVILIIFMVLAVGLMSRGLKSTISPESATEVPASVNQPLQANVQSRPQPNYLEHAADGQAYLHKLLIQSGGNLDRLKANDRTFVESVMGGHADRFFPMMYRGMTSKVRTGTIPHSKHKRSNEAI